MINTLVVYVKYKSKKECVVGYQLNNTKIHVETLTTCTQENAFSYIISKANQFSLTQVLYDGDIVLFVQNPAMANKFNAMLLDHTSPSIQSIKRAVISEFDYIINENKQAKESALAEIDDYITKINEKLNYFTNPEITKIKKRIKK